MEEHMAVVVKPFDGVPDGEIYPVRFEKGDTVEGKLADVAIAEGWATKDGKGAKKPEPDEK